MGLLSLLSQARWPQLTFLNLLSVELPSTQQGKELELHILSALRSAWVLQADTEQTSSSSSASIATLNWSSIIALSLLYQQVDTQVVTKLLHTGVNQIEVVVFDHVQLDAAVILQLTKLECPRLQRLSLRYSGIGSVAISYLAQGKWPLLEKMDLEGNVLDNEALDELFKGKWPLLEELELTVRSLHGKAITKWLGCHPTVCKRHSDSLSKMCKLIDSRSSLVPAMLTCNYHCNMLGMCTLALPL